MKCPVCKLENPDTALRCDCGYAFATGTMPAGDPVLEHLRSIDETLRYIKRLILLWAILTVVAAIVIAILRMPEQLVTPIPSKSFEKSF
jgi:hypothetical protein